MGKKLSDETKRKIVSLHKQGNPNEKIAKLLDISSGSVSKFVRLEQNLPISNKTVSQRRATRVEKNRIFLDNLKRKSSKLSKKLPILFSKKEFETVEKLWKRLEKEMGAKLTSREFVLLLVDDYSRPHTLKI